MDRQFRDRIQRLLSRARDLEKRYAARLEESRTLVEAAMSNERPERIPVTVSIGPEWSEWYLKNRYGVRVSEYWRDPKLLLEYELRTWIDSFTDFPDDRTFVIPSFFGPLGGVVLHPSIVGCRTTFPEDDFPWIDLRHVVFKDEAAIDAFEVPEIASSGLMPETLERLEQMERLVGDILELRILGGDGAPLQMAAYTRGLSQLVRDMYVAPGLVHKLMRKMMSVYEEIQRFYLERWGIRYAGGDIEGRFYDNPLSYFSPDLVERFVLPYYREFAERCGWRHWSFETQDVMDGFIDLFKQIPVRTIHSLVSSSNLSAFREALQPRGVRFKVFIAPGRLLSPATIETELRKLAETMGTAGGWMLSSGVIDSAIPEQNIHLFLEKARSLLRGEG